MTMSLWSAAWNRETATVVIIDSFESGTPSTNYTGDTANYEFTSAGVMTPPDGTQVLRRAGTVTGYDDLWSTAGLANYPVQGQPFGGEIYTDGYVGGPSAQIGPYYGVQDSNNHYHVRHEYDQDDIVIQKEVAGTATVLAQDLSATGGTLTSAGTTFLRVNWGADNSHATQLYTSEGGTQLASLGPVADSSFTTGGFGFISYRGAGTTAIETDYWREVA